jgi:hypothetical protein
MVAVHFEAQGILPYDYLYIKKKCFVSVSLKATKYITEVTVYIMEVANFILGQSIILTLPSTFFEVRGYIIDETEHTLRPHNTLLRLQSPF